MDVETISWWYVALVLTASAIFTLRSMWGAFEISTRERAARMAAEQANANLPAEVERIALRTIRGVNYITLPATTAETVRIADVYRYCGDAQYLLQQADQNCDMAGYNFLGMPSFWRAEGPNRLSLWPIPDGTYEFSIARFIYDTGYYVRSASLQQAAVNSSDLALDKSLRLMVAWLSPAQRKSLLKTDYFTVVGSYTKRKYRINLGSTYNVQQLDSAGKPLQDFCFQPTTTSCIGDVMLAQKISIENNEHMVIQVANKRAAATANSYAPANILDVLKTVRSLLTNV